jgi:hypothetical protein
MMTAAPDLISYPKAEPVDPVDPTSSIDLSPIGNLPVKTQMYACSTQIESMHLVTLKQIRPSILI